MTGRDRPRSKAYHLDSPLVEGSAYKVREFCQLPAVLVVEHAATLAAASDMLQATRKRAAEGARACADASKRRKK